LLAKEFIAIKSKRFWYWEEKLGFLSHPINFTLFLIQNQSSVFFPLPTLLEAQIPKPAKYYQVPVLAEI